MNDSCLNLINTDTQDPVFSDCPDLTFPTSDGQPTAYVTYDRPNATDNVGVKSINCFGVNEDGETLDVGVHNVTCHAFDQSDGNTS